MRRRRSHPPRLAVLLHRDLVELRALAATLARAADRTLADWHYEDGADLETGLDALSDATCAAWLPARLPDEAVDLRHLAAHGPKHAERWARGLGGKELHQRHRARKHQHPALAAAVAVEVARRMVRDAPMARVERVDAGRAGSLP